MYDRKISYINKGCEFVTDNLHMHVCFIISYFILYSYQLYNRDLHRKFQKESGLHKLSCPDTFPSTYYKTCLNRYLFKTFNDHV